MLFSKFLTFAVMLSPTNETKAKIEPTDRQTDGHRVYTELTSIY